MRPMLEKLVKTGLKIVAMDRYHYLPPLYRMIICEAFGPTFQPATKKERQQYLLSGGQYEPTFGDLGRNWLAILAARQVVSVWRETLLRADILTSHMVDPDVPLIEISVDYYRCTMEFPTYLLNLAQNILEGKISQEEAGSDFDIAQLAISNYMGAEEEEYPKQAWYVDIAAFHALLETFGYRYYNLQDGYIKREISSLETNAAPAGAAFLAYAGVYEENVWTRWIDPAASLEFWDWWLNEAIPEAWELAEKMLKERG